MFISTDASVSLGKVQADRSDSPLAVCSSRVVDMHTRAQMSLRALCDREGGYKAVAAAARVNPDYLWQIINGTPLPSGNPRGVGRQLAAKLESAFPGWDSIHPAAAGEKPATYTVAQSASQHQSSNDLPLLAWEAILSSSTPDLFRAVLNDDALAPELPRGTEIVWTTRRLLLPGRVVLVKDRRGQLHARRCHQGTAPGHWIAAASNSAYRSFDSTADGLTVIAVYKGTLEPDDH